MSARAGGARASGRRIDASLWPAGLTTLQVSLLMALSRPEPPNMAKVARLLTKERTTLTGAVKPLAMPGIIGVVSALRGPAWSSVATDEP